MDYYCFTYGLGTKNVKKKYCWLLFFISKVKRLKNQEKDIRECYCIKNQVRLVILFVLFDT